MESELYRLISMWELPQNLGLSVKLCGTHTFRKFLLIL
ncbi:hypothetical protein LEP1GSC173_2410 [Leptospira interrogans str. HAI1594]|uniref:Uncharacterized protein n=1 Tax=Leptospira interrogans serovar Hardjo str. Norma TaxID=1279460 RepID=A0A0M3TLX9_LEPIR|nr:hypothetical protein G436_2691 [Leptospira interrogans serovar Hardjo str. Norma]EKP77876.1 hypothetical protein LEP1GSC173_2410 [Leptospira interrogans str. HAI1594]